MSTATATTWIAGDFLCVCVCAYKEMIIIVFIPEKSKQLRFNVKRTEDVLNVKKLIYDKTKISISEQVL